VFLDPFPEEDEAEARELGDAVESIAPETLRAFVTVAVLVHVGLFAASLGAMLAAFRGQTALGGAVAAGGLLALALAVRAYRRRPSAD